MHEEWGSFNKKVVTLYVFYLNRVRYCGDLSIMSSHFLVKLTTELMTFYLLPNIKEQRFGPTAELLKIRQATTGNV